MKQQKQRRKRITVHLLALILSLVIALFLDVIYPAHIPLLGTIGDFSLVVTLQAIAYYWAGRLYPDE